MKFKDLHDLINTSYRAREYFVSLPVSVQMSLHEVNELIQTERELMSAAKRVMSYNKEDELKKAQLMLRRF